MIIFDEDDIIVSNNKGICNVLIRGHFKELTNQEYTYLTFNPIKLIPHFTLKYINYAYKATIVHQVKIPLKFFPFIKKTQTRTYDIMTYSYNYINPYGMVLPPLEKSLSGEFVFDLTIEQKEYKKYEFNKKLRELLKD